MRRRSWSPSADAGALVLRTGMLESARDRSLEGFWGPAGEDRRRFVDRAFAAVAGDYDRLVRLFSGGLDRRWRQACVQACEISRAGWVLDCATGTGALALAADRQAGATARVVGADACGPMLREARWKAAGSSSRASWVQAHVEGLPLRSESVSAVTLGFGLRHMEVNGSMAEMARVLVPGGRVAVLEFLRPPPGIQPWLALAYLRWLVPPLAGLAARSRAAWTLAAYLPRTIEAGPSVPDVVEAMERVGLRVVRLTSLFAQVVWLIVAVKPVPEIPKDASR